MNWTVSIIPDTLIITYGVTSRAARDAVRRLRGANKNVSLLILKTLYPVPEKMLQRTIASAAKIVVVEMNLGQYVREVERLSSPGRVVFYGKMDGELISPEEIMDAIRR